MYSRFAVKTILRPTV